MALERVSFKKPVQRQPRISAPYVPGKHSARWWTEEERQILRDYYTAQGPDYCLMKLPNRTSTGIYGEAKKLGLARPRQSDRKAETYDRPGIDDEIRTAWPELSGKKRGEVNDLARKLGVPRWWLSHRAKKLGLTLVRWMKEPNWTQAEFDLLKNVPLHDADRAAAIFRDHGFHRTGTAIIIKAARRGISRRFKEALSASAVAKILGVDVKTITMWIGKGFMKAGKRPTKRTAQQGGDWWTITREELKRFIIDNIERIDMRKVEKFSFVEILAGIDAEGAPAQ